MTTAHADRHSHLPAVLIGALLATLLIGYRVAHPVDSGVRDLFSVYWGARAWMHHGDAYHLLPVVPSLTDPVTYTYVKAGGNVYPMTAVLLFVPLAVMPPLVASVAYIAACVTGLVVALRVLRAEAMALAYLPLVLALHLEQVTALMVVVSLLAVAAVREQRALLGSACIAVLLLVKPSETLLIAAVLAWDHRQHWRSLATIGGAWTAVSFVAQPDWLRLWIEVALDRNDNMDMTAHWLWWLLPVAALLWKRGDRLGAAAIAQTALLPTPLLLYPQSYLVLDALTGRRVWLLLVGQFATLFLWPVSRPLAVVLGLVLPRALAGTQRSQRDGITRPRPSQSAVQQV
jgi:hypothetical protein